MPIKIIRRAEAPPQPEPVPVVPAAPAPNQEDDGLEIPAFLRRTSTPKQPTPRKLREAGQPLDGMCQAAIASTPNAIVSWVLMASYLYYHHDIGLLSDGYYDELCRTMLTTWDLLQHEHKRLIKVEDLKAGSLYALKPEDYPQRLKYATRFLVREEWGIEIEVA